MLLHLVMGELAIVVTGGDDDAVLISERLIDD